MSTNTAVENARGASLREIVMDEGHKYTRGSNHIKICCVFHNERTPSLAIYENGYYCFGCGEHGDTIAWIMKTRGMEFMQAVRYLQKYV